MVERSNKARWGEVVTTTLPPYHPHTTDIYICTVESISVSEYLSVYLCIYVYHTSDAQQPPVCSRQPTTTTNSRSSLSNSNNISNIPAAVR